MVLPASRHFQSLENLGAGGRTTVEPSLPVLSFGRLSQRGRMPPHSPSPQLTSSLIHLLSCGHIHFSSSIFSIPIHPSPHRLPPSWISTTPRSRREPTYVTPPPTQNQIQRGRWAVAPLCRPLPHHPIRAVQQTQTYPTAPASRPVSPVSLALSYPSYPTSLPS